MRLVSTLALDYVDDIQPQAFWNLNVRRALISRGPRGTQVTGVFMKVLTLDELRRTSQDPNSIHLCARDSQNSIDSSQSRHLKTQEHLESVLVPLQIRVLGELFLAFNFISIVWDSESQCAAQAYMVRTDPNSSRRSLRYSILPQIVGVKDRHPAPSNLVFWRQKQLCMQTVSILELMIAFSTAYTCTVRNNRYPWPSHRCSIASAVKFALRTMKFRKWESRRWLVTRANDMGRMVLASVLLLRSHPLMTNSEYSIQNEITYQRCRVLYP